MAVELEKEYLVAIGGLAVGAVVGLIVMAASRRSITRARSMRTWDSRFTLPLLVAAAGAHLVLIPAVEPQRQVLFGLYGAALLGVVIFAIAGLGIWRLGAVLFPAGSIAAYFYFALPEHHADYIGLLVKVVELMAIAAAIVPVFRSRRTYRKVAF